MSDMPLPVEELIHELAERPRLRLLPGGVDAVDADVLGTLEWADAEAQAWLEEADAEAEAILARADAHAAVILDGARTTAGLLLAAARAQADHLLEQAIRARLVDAERPRGWRRLLGIGRSR